MEIRELSYDVIFKELNEPFFIREPIGLTLPQFGLVFQRPQITTVVYFRLFSIFVFLLFKLKFFW